jgi:hypothetical protein
MQTTNLRRAIWFVPLVVIALAACASGPKIRSQSAPGADFSSYRTYGFLDEVAGTQPAYSSFVAQYLKKAVSRELQARGLALAGNPDLLINFNLVTKDKVQISQTPSAYYGYRRGYAAWGGGVGYATTDVSSYTEGTLNVDVVERAKMQLVWEATAIGRVKDKALENPEPAINQVISQIFEAFPRAAVASSPST